MLTRIFRKTLAALALLGLSSAVHAQSYMYAFSFGKTGTANGQFHGAHGVVADANNNILVVDGGNRRVETFDANGNFLHTLKISNANLLEVGLQPNGNIVVGGGGYIGIFDPLYNPLSSFKPMYASIGTVATFPNGLIGTRETRQLPSGSEAYVAVYDTSGHLVRNIGDVSAPINARLGLPEDMIVSKTGVLYVADSDKGVMKYDVNGNFLGQFGQNVLDKNVAGIAVDDSGNVAVSAITGNVYFFDDGGNFTGQLQSPVPIGDAFDVAFSPNGNFLVTEASNNRVDVFRPLAVPEPGGLALCFGLVNGGAALLLLRRRRGK